MLLFNNCKNCGCPLHIQLQAVDITPYQFPDCEHYLAGNYDVFAQENGIAGNFYSILLFAVLGNSKVHQHDTNVTFTPCKSCSISLFLFVCVGMCVSYTERFNLCLGFK